MGDNTYGELGNGTTTNAATPTRIGGGTTWSAVAVGSNFTVAVASNGTLWAWGDNTYGQLGHGTTTNAASPEQIASGYTVLPAITSTVPANGATDVDIASTIQATFSEAMDPTSITTATFTLGGGVTGARSP